MGVEEDDDESWLFSWLACNDDDDEDEDDDEEDEDVGAVELPPKHAVTLDAAPLGVFVAEDDDEDDEDDELSNDLEARLRNTRLIDDTLGILSWLQTFSLSSLSRISHANIEGHSRLYEAIFVTTSDVATRGLLPPIARGLILPVS